HGVVEQPVVPFADRAETFEEVSELLSEVAVVAAPGRHRAVADAMMSAAGDAEDRGEAIADADAVFGAYLIGRNARSIGFEREHNQVQHGANVVGWPARRHVEVDRVAIDLRQRSAKPFLGT